MLNHKDKYIHFQLYQQSEFQKIYIAQKKIATHEAVLVNVLSKSSLVQPVDVSGVINAIHCLEMLEEDNDNWYFITTHFSGNDVFSPAEAGIKSNTPFNNLHFIQLMNLISTYDYLTPYYQMMLLKENQFILHNNRLVSKEVLDLAFLPDDLPDFTAVKTQLNVLIAQALQLLKISMPECYGTTNWQTQFSKANSLNTLKELTQLWSEEIQVLANRLQPEVLENLYAVKKEPDQIKNTDVTEKRYASLQGNDQTPRQKKNGAIILTCVLALGLIIASFTPSLLDYFKHLGANHTTSEVKNNTDNTTSDKGGTSDGTGADNAGDNTASAELEQLNPKNISFLSGNWTYDITQYHTGDRSLKLIFDSTNTSSIVQFTNLEIPQNPSFSLWMRSAQGGNVKAIFTFSKGSQEIGSYEENLNFETGEQWYLMNPLSNGLPKKISEADTLKIELTGDVKTLWLDDLLFESFK